MSVYRQTSANPGRKSVNRGARLRRILSFLLVAAVLVMVGQTVPAGAAGEPTVTRVSPSNGPLKGGQTVVITGTGFTGTTGVKFGTVAATSHAVMTDKSIVAVVPDAAAGGSVLVEVTNANGANTTGANYEYKAPTIKKIEPGWAKNSASSFVTITGTGLLGTVKADVKFGTAPALDVWVISDTSMVVKTPIDDSGNSISVANGVLDVVITRNSVASATGDASKFLFSPGVPTITQLGDPSVVKGTDGAAVGTLLTVKGTQLWGASKVSFDTTAVIKAADIVVASDGNSLTVKVPTRSNGPVDVVVKNAAGDSVTNLSTAFSYYSTVAPKVTKVYPAVVDKTATTGGGTVLVTGSGLTGVTKTLVTVKCTSDITPTSATPVSDKSLVLVLPDNAGTAEACDLEIKNPVDNTKLVTSVGAIRYV